MCRNCDSIHYQNPRVIAGCIPWVDDRVLLCRRAIDPRSGFWTLPAGFLENGESSLTGALRECHEEALARIQAPALACLYDIPHINQVYIFYRGELADMDFGVGEESTEVDLFREDEVPWSELAFPVVELALHHYFEDLKRGEFEIRSDALDPPWRWIRS